MDKRGVNMLSEKNRLNTQSPYYNYMVLMFTAFPFKKLYLFIFII